MRLFAALHMLQLELCHEDGPTTNASERHAYARADFNRALYLLTRRCRAAVTSICTRRRDRFTELDWRRTCLGPMARTDAVWMFVPIVVPAGLMRQTLTCGRNVALRPPASSLNERGLFTRKNHYQHWLATPDRVVAANCLGNSQRLGTSMMHGSVPLSPATSANKAQWTETKAAACGHDASRFSFSVLPS